MLSLQPFANDSVLDFYPKFGFKEAKEYQYSKDVTIDAMIFVSKAHPTKTRPKTGNTLQ